jgi:hypothetical protein
MCIFCKMPVERVKNYYDNQIRKLIILLVLQGLLPVLPLSQQMET